MLVVVMSGQSLYQLGVITYFQVNRSFIAEFLCMLPDEEVESGKRGKKGQGQCSRRKRTT
jgi:hypothetical protein